MTGRGDAGKLSRHWLDHFLGQVERIRSILMDLLRVLYLTRHNLVPQNMNIQQPHQKSYSIYSSSDFKNSKIQTNSFVASKFILNFGILVTFVLVPMYRQSWKTVKTRKQLTELILWINKTKVGEELENVTWFHPKVCHHQERINWEELYCFACSGRKAWYPN